jgi:hypothetical protein
MLEKSRKSDLFWAIFACFCLFFLACAHLQQPAAGDRADGGPLDRGFMLTADDQPMHLRCDQLPIRIIAPAEWAPAFVAASIMVNAAVGKTIYSISGTYNFIVPVVESSNRCDARGCRMTTNLSASVSTGEAESAYIFVPEGHAYEKPLIWVPTLHELLHVIGLAHDAREIKSIMNEEFDMHDDPPPLTPEDVARLRAMYGSC